MEHGRDQICRLCLKLCETSFEAICGIARELFETLLSNLNLNISEDPVMCRNCSENLYEYSKFQLACQATQNYILSFANDKVCAKLDLTEIYHIKNKSDNIINTPDYNICRFCMELVKCGSLINLNTEQKDVVLVKVMISNCLQELDLSITEDPIICLSCHSSLQSHYNFLVCCFDTEEKIQEYCGVERITGKDQVNLSRVLEFTSKKMLGYKDEVYIKSENVMEIPEQVLNIKREEIKVESYQEELNSFQDECLPQLKVRPTLPSKVPLQIKQYKCEICLFVTKYDWCFEQHKTTHSTVILERTESGVFKCDICAYETKARNSINRHLKIHDKIIKIYKCSVCAYETTAKKKLNKHLTIHAKEVKIYKCSICAFGTACEHDFRNHLFSPEHPSCAACDICLFVTKRKYNLTQHMLIHRDLSEITRFKCELCTYAAYRKKQLNNHMRLIHNFSTQASS